MSRYEPEPDAGDEPAPERGGKHADTGEPETAAYAQVDPDTGPETTVYPQSNPDTSPETTVYPESGRAEGRSAHATPISHEKAAGPEPAPGTRSFDQPSPRRPAGPNAAGPIAFNEGTAPLTRERALARGRNEFGGVKVGSAFFGWLSATGLAVLLTGIAAGIIAAFGLSTDVSLGQMADNAAAEQSVSTLGAVILLAILLIAYFCGGYVAGRMSRFNGVRQGFAVWLWAIFFAIVLGILGTVLGNQYDLINSIDTFSRLTFFGSNLIVGIISVLVVAAVTLGGTLLGGWAGMRYHRRVDRAIFEE